MSNGYGFGSEEIKEESSWRYPLGIFFATLVLCAIFLYYYVGPSVEEFSGNTPSPAITEEIVTVTVGETQFSPAANFTVYPRARRGGTRDELTLYTLWPLMQGYTPARRDEFIENAPDTRRVDIIVRRRTSPMSEQERIDTLYLPRTVDPAGTRTPYKLDKYAFQDADNANASVPTDGFEEIELYLGEDSNGDMVSIFCFKELEEIPSPECWRKLAYNANVEVSYRFKRPYLPDWQDINEKVLNYIRTIDSTDNRRAAN